MAGRARGTKDRNPPAGQRVERRADAEATRQRAQIYESLPYGLIVVDQDGAILGANPAAVQMSWDVERGGPPLACHDLLDCRGPQGPCEHGCLVQRAAHTGETLPEIRVDTPAGSPVSAVWLTVAPLGMGAGVVLHLRRGDARDRRRRSEPHWIKDPELTITALGRTRVDSREGPLGGAWVQQRPGQILKFLVCERDRVVHGEEIAEALWPQSGRKGLNNVRHFVHQLRDRLGSTRARDSGSGLIVTVRGGYAVNRRYVRMDVDDFEHAARDGLGAADRGEVEAAAEQLEHALSLYRGDFLEDEPYAEWALAERDRLRSLATEALRMLVRLALDRGAQSTAAHHLERLTEFEPFDADAQRELMRVWLVLGRRTEALRRYGTYRAQLQHEFGETPDFTLSDLKASG